MYSCVCVICESKNEISVPMSNEFCACVRLSGNIVFPLETETQTIPRYKWYRKMLNALTGFSCNRITWSRMYIYIHLADSIQMFLRTGKTCTIKMLFT